MTNPDDIAKLMHVHIPKTGGSWLNSQLEKHFPHNYMGHKPWHVKLSSFRNDIPPQGRNRSMYAGVAYGSAPFLHFTGTGPELESCVTVSICRNPFDYLVSFYHHHNPIRSSYGVPSGCNDVNTIHGIRSFEEFIKKFCDPGFPFADDFRDIRSFLFHQMFDDTGRCGVDVIFKNEQLHSATETFISSVKGSPIVLNKRRENTSKLREKKDYRSYYTDELRELVELKCAAELLLFGYDFDGSIEDPLFVNPHSLFYHPVYPVAGVQLPVELLREHQRLLGMCDNDPEKWEMRLISHITPDIFVYRPQGGPYNSTPGMDFLAGNIGDPKPMVLAYEQLTGMKVRAYCSRKSPFFDHFAALNWLNNDDEDPNHFHESGTAINKNI